MTIEIEGCKDCWFSKGYLELDGYYTDCEHPLSPTDNEILDLETVPDWCPLQKESVELKLKDKDEKTAKIL